MGSPALDLRAAVSQQLAAYENRRGQLLGARARRHVVDQLVAEGSSWRRQLEGLAGQHGAGLERDTFGIPSGRLGRIGAVSDQLEGDRLAAAAETFRSHLTNNVSSPSRGAQLGRMQGRRRERWRLRETAQRLTHRGRLLECGHRVVDAGVSIVIGASGVAHYSGLRYCGRLWLCPVCAARIAYGRSQELQELLRRHADAGGGTLFGTFTVPHSYGDALRSARELVADLWRRAKQGREWQAERDRYGIIGVVRALEATHGANGWHPHIHALILTDRELDPDDVERWRRSFASRWIAACARLTGRAPMLRHQVVERALSAGDLAEYIAKIARAGEADTTGGNAARELTRWDVKGGGRRVDRPGRSPFGILADYGESRRRERSMKRELERRITRSRRQLLERELVTVRKVADGDRKLWREWERAMHGAKQLTWSRGLRARYNVPEQTDEELANARIGGMQICRLSPALWHAVKLSPGLTTLLLEEAEDGGVAAVQTLIDDARDRWRERGMILGRDAELVIEPLAQRTVA